MNIEVQKLIDATKDGVTESQLVGVFNLAIEKGCKLMGDDMIGYQFVSENGQHTEFNNIIGILLMQTDSDICLTSEFFQQNGIDVLPYDSAKWRK